MKYDHKFTRLTKRGFSKVSGEIGMELIMQNLEKLYNGYFALDLPSIKSKPPVKRVVCSTAISR